MCGIFGRISTTKKPLDKHKFNALGVTNDSRGGDSCGIFFDGEVEIGHDKNKYYESFMSKSVLLKNTNKTKIAFGHCRKASIGDVSFATAQPVCLYDQHGKIEYVLIHNGTIYNYEDLAKKYIPHIDIKGMTDSQVMARIFYWCGYDVLEEYNGAAVFVIADYRVEEGVSPTIYMYKGASKIYESSNAVTIERPLFLTIADKEIWFSSMAAILDAMSYPEECLTLNPNVLVEVTVEDTINLVTVKEVDRSKQIQNKKYTYSYNNNTTSSRRAEYDNYYGYGLYDRYGNYDNDLPFDTNRKLLGNGKSTKDDKKIDIVDEKGISLWINDTDNSVKGRMALCADGLYRHNGLVAHGGYNLSRFGYGHVSVGRIESCSYFFFQGRLIPNYEIFKLLTEISTAFALTPTDLGEDYSTVIDKYSYIPIVNIVHGKNEVEIFEVDDFDNVIPFTGIIAPLFSHTCFQFHVADSQLVDKRDTSKLGLNNNHYDMFVENWKDVEIDNERQGIMSYITTIQEEELVKMIKKEEERIY